MTLTTARGPLGPDPAGRFTPPLETGTIYAEPHPRRIVAIRNGEAVIDTEDAWIVHRAGQPLSYAFPESLVQDLPSEPERVLPGYGRVPWDAVDAWFEEGRRLVHYPPNPYHRVDCRPTSRRLRVDVAGTTMADTDDTIIVFETSLAPVLYVAPAQVRVDLLRRSATTSYCNYKGEATYWTAVIGDTVIQDVAWSYQDPLPESQLIEGHLSFYTDKAEVFAELPPY